jgi:hypothetical protein
MTSSLSPAAAPVIEPIGVPNTFPFPSGPFPSGPFASGPFASGERVRVIDDSRPNIQAGEFVTAVGASELLFRPAVRAGHGRPMALLRNVRLQDIRDKDPLKRSGGRRRRVAAPRALVHDLATPLIDEPVEEITVEMPRTRRLEVVGGALGSHVHRTSNDPDAEAVAAAAGSAGQQEDWR